MKKLYDIETECNPSANKPNDKNEKEDEFTTLKKKNLA